MLERYRMLDLSRFLPGPFASHILADWGMDILKVEETLPRYGMGRDSITPPDPTPEEDARYAAHNSLARNKRSISLNLLDPKLRPESQEVFYRLVKDADVVLEGYRPGVAKWMGVDYETLKQINPRIICCSISGYGQEGPYVKRPGHDGQFVAITGLMGGRNGEGEPRQMGVALADVSSALWAANAILAALLEREVSGEGQYIDVPMAGVVMAYGLTASTQLKTPRYALQRTGPGLGVLKCKDGQYISTGNADQIFWANFMNAIGRPQYADKRDVQGDEWSTMVEEVMAHFLTKTRDEWLEILIPAETCVAPIHMTMEEAFQDPQIQAIGMAWNLDHPTEGTVRQLGSPVRFSRTPAHFRNFAPVWGQETRDVLADAGYDAATIDDLEARGIIRTAADPSAVK